MGAGPPSDGLSSETHDGERNLYPLPRQLRQPLRLQAISWVPSAGVMLFLPRQHTDKGIINPIFEMVKVSSRRLNVLPNVMPFAHDGGRAGMCVVFV